MSQIFPHVTPQHPCPICQKPDWCQFGDRAIKCMRVESRHTCPSGGWWHFYDSWVKPDFVPRTIERPKQSVDCAAIMLRLKNETDFRLIGDFADSLGVTTSSLITLDVAYCKEKAAWAFPMKGGDGKVIGIRLRNMLGFKWAVTGSRQGIFIPSESVMLPTDKTVYLPEGPTDTVAMLSLGLYAVGRPNCMCGGDQLKIAIRRLGFRKVVIVADNDGPKENGGKWSRPGLDGANKLKKELGLPSVIWMPPAPFKDAREYVNHGGTAQSITSAIKNRVWTIK